MRSSVAYSILGSHYTVRLDLTIFGIAEIFMLGWGINIHFKMLPLT